ncbi:hypothetical protein Tco_0866273 [Tanacetum coccineum]
MERAATTASSLDAEQDSGAKIPYWEVQMLKLGLRLHLNSPSDPLPKRLHTWNEVGEGQYETIRIDGTLYKIVIFGEQKEKRDAKESLCEELIDDRSPFWKEIEVNAGGTDCLPTATIFEELARMGYEKPSQKLTFYKAFFSPHGSFNFMPLRNALVPRHCMERISVKQSRRKQKKTTAVPHPSDSTADVPNEESVPTHSNDPLLSGDTKFEAEISVKKLEKKARLRTHKFKRLYKVSVTKRVEYSDDESLGAQDDASKHGRSITDIDKDVKVSLVDETQGRSDDAEMFDTDALIGNEVFAKNDMIEKDQDMIPKEVSTACSSTTAVSPPVITKSTATTAPSTIPKAKGITFRDASESTTRTITSVSSLSIKDKGKAKIDEPEMPLEKKDQIALDEEMARNIEAQIQAELIKEERLARKKEMEAHIALIESWDNTQAKMEADFELAQRLQAEEQGEITIEEISRLFVELMNKRKKHFAKLRAEEKRRNPPTKAQKINLMSTYLKNMGGYKYNQLKKKSYDEIQKLFDNEMKRVNTFILMDSESKKAESSEKNVEGNKKKSIGKKRAGKEQKQESSKRQRMEDDKETDEHEEAEMKKHMEVVQYDEKIEIDVIHLATKPPIIVEYKIVKEGQKGFYHLIRADGSSNRYSSMIRML